MFKDILRCMQRSAASPIRTSQYGLDLKLISGAPQADIFDQVWHD